jgi:hypothetical protein
MKNFSIALVVIAGAAASVNANPFVKAVHASPDAPAVNILVNGGLAIPNLAFKSASDYAALAGAGTYNVAVAAAPGTTPIFDRNFDLPATGNFSIVATGRLGTAGEFDLTPFADDNTQIADRARIRFIHASPNAPAVDITLADGTVLFGNTTFRNSAGYTAVPGGTYDLQVRLAGTTTVVLEVPGVAVANNTVISVYAMGLVGGQGAQALAAVPVVDVIPAPGAAAMLGLAGLVATRRRR